ncbi:hypothetical protein FV218_16305 [Methylobacterium sp. WL69]|nr:hypothetical protein FV218_16305 [Methylobacterium sp. WL69]
MREPIACNSSFRRRSTGQRPQRATATAVPSRVLRSRCPSSDDLGHSAVFRSGGSGPSGVRG